MTSFWRLYSVCLTVMILGIQLLQWQFPAFVQSIKEVPTRVISIPPKPKGVQEVTDGEGDEVLYTEEGCRNGPEQFRDICFHQLARQQAQTDLDGANQVCAKISSEEVQWECMADIAELYSPVDRNKALELCPSIERKKWRDQCVFGIALAYSTVDSPWAFRRCDDAGQWRDFCRHDVNGEIAVVNVELALANCAKEEGDLLTRKTCWHGIGKYLARVDVDAAFAACDQVPPGPQNLYRENCIHGLGWGASETAEEDFIPTCRRSGKERDSCLLGIAYNLRRFDIDRGLRICDQVQRVDLHDQCNRFVSGGRL